MPIPSQFPDVEIPDTSIFDYLFGDITDEERGQLFAINGMDGSETTFGELIDQINAMAGALAARGIGVGDVVAVHVPNVPAFATVLHGILRAGAVATTINALYTGPEIAKQIEDAGAKMLFTVSPLYPQAKEAAGLAGLSDDKVIVLDGMEGHENLLDLLLAFEPAPDVSFDPATHLAVLPYSSGTTGNPKGVMLTHRNLVANIAQTSVNLPMSNDVRVLAVLPFFHIYGLTVLLNVAVKGRAPLVTMPRFDLAEFLRNIQDHKVTHAFIAPPIAVALAKHPMVEEYDLSTLEVVFSGAASLDGKLGAEVAKRLGCVVRQGYGMSEMSPVSHAIPIDRDDIPLDSVGLAVPNLEMKLIDPLTGEEIQVPESGDSEPGELLCRGPNIMVGYLNNPEATAETFDDEGFLHTGDIATVNAGGWVTIVDRLKELIKYKGYQVAPAELEALLLSNPEIADAAVVGVADDDGEEIPKAFVVRQPNSEITAEQVMSFVEENVAPHKKVRRVEFIDEIPKSAAGKILRKDLREA